jgi:hypothetical protein
VTVVSGVIPEEREHLAGLMSHSSATQQRVYNDMCKLGDHIRVSNLLKKILSGNEITNDDLKEREFGNYHYISLLVILKQMPIKSDINQ